MRRKDGGFSMIAAEMYTNPHWIAMRLGVYTSRDGLYWDKKRTLRQSTGKFDGGPHSASWGPFFLHDPSNDTWMLSYVGYRSSPNNSSGWLANYDGKIYTRYASEAGDAGLDSDFGDGPGAFAADTILIGPDDFHVNGPWPHPCQGMQGTDSFYPFQLNDGTWAGFAGTSQQQANANISSGKWPVSLATAPALQGPWTRWNPEDKTRPADAPCVDINGGRTENPIVSRRPDNPRSFHMVYDDLGGEGYGFGYACSEDGLHWSKGVNVAVHGGVRTPFGLLPLTESEKSARKADILAAGVLNESTFDAANTSLQWAFYTANRPGWEEFFASIVQIKW